MRSSGISTSEPFILSRKQAWKLIFDSISLVVDWEQPTLKYVADKNNSYRSDKELGIIELPDANVVCDFKYLHRIVELTSSSGHSGLSRTQTVSHILFTSTATTSIS